MQKTRVIGFTKAYANKMKRDLLKPLIEEQSRRLVVYAEKTIQEIGARIQTYNSLNHMDRTGNLLDSLCWCVSYEGKVVKSGFYRQQKASKLSYLHEWFKESHDAFPVGGHVLASNFIKQMSNLKHSGWRVFFAILADYWGYWEEGFTFKGRRGSHKFLRFAVMSEFYDKISQDLRPATVNIKYKAPTYNRADLEKKRDKRDKRASSKGGFSVYDKYSKGKGQGKYDY